MSKKIHEEIIKLKKIGEIDITDKYHKSSWSKSINDIAIDPLTGDILLILSQEEPTPNRICVFDSDLNELVSEESKSLWGLEHPSAAFYRKDDLVIGNSDDSSLYFFAKGDYTKTKEALQIKQTNEGHPKPYLQQVIGKNDSTLFVLMQSLYLCKPEENIVERFGNINVRCIAKDNMGNLYGANDLDGLVIQSIGPDGSVVNVIEQENFGVFIFDFDVDCNQRMWIKTHTIEQEPGEGTYLKLRYYDKSRFRKAFRKMGDVITFKIDKQNNLYLCYRSLGSLLDQRIMLAKYSIGD